MAMLAAFLFTGCNPTSSQPTVAPLPTFAVGDSSISSTAVLPIAHDTPAAPPSSEPDRVWSERRVGAATVSVTFYSQNEQRCIRLAVKDAKTGAVERCEQPGATLVAVQANITDSDGRAFTVVTGSSLKGQAIVVSTEMDHADNTHVEQSYGG